MWCACSAACQRQLEEERQREAPLRNALHKQKSVDAAAARRRDELLTHQRAMKANRQGHEATITELTNRLDSCEAKLEDLDSDVARRQRDLEKEKLTLSRLQEAQGKLRPDAEVEAELQHVVKQRIEGRQELHAHNHKMEAIQYSITEIKTQKIRAQNRSVDKQSRHTLLCHSALADTDCSWMRRCVWCLCPFQSGGREIQTCQRSASASVAHR